MRTLLLRGILSTYRAALAPAAARFDVASRVPHLAQRARFIALMRRAEGTAFERDHDLARIHTFEDYQDAVPIRDYDALSPYIERMLLGEPRILTNERPGVFERTSGSTSATKLLPYPKALFAEFSAATSPWLYDLYTRRPALRRTSAYWSISPVGQRQGLTPGGERIGLGDDTEYFPPAVRKLLRTLLPVPGEVAQLRDMASCRYVTLRYLLADRHLGLISVWSPSFLTLLLEFAREHADRLASDITAGTLRPPSGPVPAELGLLPLLPDPAQGAAVRDAFERGPLDLTRVWPELALVSCWTEAAAIQQLGSLRALLPPQVEIQGKGLLATEGVVSFPLLGRKGAVLAVNSHLLELRPAGDPEARPVLPHKAELGGVYQPILSTGGGLYRYPLGDAVEVIGRHHATPRVRFLGRLDGVSDLCGEKLAPARVESVLGQALAGVPGVCFRLLAPTPGDPPAYTLFLEGPSGPALEPLAEEVDRLLRAGHHYDYCRRLGQLGPVRVRAVERGIERYEGALVERGQKVGDIKPPGLHRGQFWDTVYAASSPLKNAAGRAAE